MTPPWAVFPRDPRLSRRLSLKAIGKDPLRIQLEPRHLPNLRDLITRIPSKWKPK